MLKQETRTAAGHQWSVLSVFVFWGSHVLLWEVYHDIDFRRRVFTT